MIRTCLGYTYEWFSKGFVGLLDLPCMDCSCWKKYCGVFKSGKSSITGGTLLCEPEKKVMNMKSADWYLNKLYEVEKSRKKPINSGTTQIQICLQSAKPCVIISLMETAITFNRSL